MSWGDLAIGGGLVVGFVLLRSWLLPRLGVPT